MSSVKFRYPIKPQAEAVQNCTSGMPNSSATFLPKPIIPSNTMQLTGGRAELSLITSSLKGTGQCFLVDSHSARASWVASRSDGGIPSGIVSNWKSGRPFTWSGPLDRIKRLWLNSVLTKVMWKPLECRSLDKFIMGITCPCVGYGTHTAWGFFNSTESIFSYPIHERLGGLSFAPFIEKMLRY